MTHISGIISDYVNFVSKLDLIIKSTSQHINNVTAAQHTLQNIRYNIRLEISLQACWMLCVCTISPT